MKKSIIILAALISLQGLRAQTLNEKGLYVDDNYTSSLFNGELFNGIVTKTQDGIKSEFTVQEGVLNGTASYYYASGKLMETGTFTKGQKDQKWVRYSENGNISAIAFYALGKKTGTWVVFDDHNKKRIEMNYDNGEKTGVWTTWDEAGAIVSTKAYGQFN
jgi:antitoxin component YwqK of YwqJK toxin-antitoxin module